MTLQDKVDDGQWHRVVIQTSGNKKKRKTLLLLDNRSTKSVRLPKNKVFRELYVGGFVENITLPISVVSLYT